MPWRLSVLTMLASFVRSGPLWPKSAEGMSSAGSASTAEARLTQVSHFGVLDASSCEESADAGQASDLESWQPCILEP